MEPLCSLYKEDMRLLNLKFNELLVSFVDWLQGLEILQWEIKGNSEPKYELVIQMVEQIEYTLFSGMSLREHNELAPNTAKQFWRSNNAECLKY